MSFVNDGPSIIMAHNGDFKGLQEMELLGYPIDVNAISIIAAHKKNIDMLKWAFMKGSNSKKEIVGIVRQNNNEAMMTLAIEY